MTIHEIERRLEELARGGHTTGHGAFKGTHPGTCMGCGEMRRWADRWDDWQRDFDKRSLAS